MANFTFELVSPERLIYSGQVDGVDVPGSEGDFGVGVGHAPFLSALRAGILTIHAQGQSKRMFVRGGFAEVNATGLTVLAERATPVEEIDLDHVRQLIKNAGEDLADAKTDDARQKAQTHLADLTQVLSVLTTAGASSAH